MNKQHAAGNKLLNQRIGYKQTHIVNIEPQRWEDYLEVNISYHI